MVLYGATLTSNSFFRACVKGGGECRPSKFTRFAPPNRVKKIKKSLVFSHVLTYLSFAMQYQIERSEKFNKYKTPFVTVDICKKINDYRIKQERIMVIFSNGEQACAVFLDRKETAYVLRNNFKNKYKRLTEKGWR